MFYKFKCKFSFFKFISVAQILKFVVFKTSNQLFTNLLKRQFLRDFKRVLRFCTKLIHFFCHHYFVFFKFNFKFNLFIFTRDALNTKILVFKTSFYDHQFNFFVFIFITTKTNTFVFKTLFYYFQINFSIFIFVTNFIFTLKSLIMI